MAEKIKPNKLKKGDTVAVIALSWGGHDVFPHIVEKGIERLEKEFGFKIIKGDTLSMTAKELYDNPKKRAEDLHKQFLNPKVKGIISLIGGDDSCRVLEHIDIKIIKENFKFYMGYSDTTATNAYFNKHGLVTFNGPCVMAGFAESINLEDDFIKYINKFLFEDWNEYEYQKFNRYAERYLDWSDPKNLEKENIYYVENNDEWHFIQGKETVEGELYGGCIEVLEFLKGTDYWPEKSFWKNKILFFETSEDKPSVQNVGYFLRNYGIQGVFDKINGIIFGRPKDYTDMEKEELEEEIKKILKEFRKEDLPVITNMDFGHTNPQFIMPLGIKAEIDIENFKFKLKESIWNKK